MTETQSPLEIIASDKEIKIGEDCFQFQSQLGYQLRPLSPAEVIRTTIFLAAQEAQKQRLLPHNLVLFESKSNFGLPPNYELRPVYDTAKPREAYCIKGYKVAKDWFEIGDPIWIGIHIDTSNIPAQALDISLVTESEGDHYKLTSICDATMRRPELGIIPSDSARDRYDYICRSHSGRSITLYILKHVNVRLDKR